MTTEYAIKKCKFFGFAKTMKDADKNIDGFNFVQKLEDLDEINEKDPIIVIDLESKIFDDIKIAKPKTDKEKIETTNEKTLTKDDMKRQLSGESSQLDAFTQNTFAVILGKKSANIPTHFGQNHDVLDSLARNGVVCSPKSSEVLSIQRLMEKLHKFSSFSIFAIHSALDLSFVSHEYPSEISHPSYIIGKGEICAIFYRYLLLNFFGYCSIITDSMRENNYIF